MHTTDKAGPLKRSMPVSPKLPPYNFKHVERLTDDTGMIQHAVYDIPNRKEGYCIDDNARALLLAVWADNVPKSGFSDRLLPIYLGYIHYMQTDDGHFRNFMTYCKDCPEEYGSEDSFGRTIMALGYLVSEGKSELHRKTAAEIISRALPQIEKLHYIRGIANTLIGISQFMRSNNEPAFREILVSLADKMVDFYNRHSTPDWHWFEHDLTYDNGFLPLALLHAYELTARKRYLDIALQSMNFLEQKVWEDGILRPVGNNGWYSYGQEEPARFDQQGVDAMAMVLLYREAYRIHHRREYLDRMFRSYRWFLGLNDLGVSLYDPATGGCADGLHMEGINLNQGAESTLAYWISHLAVARQKL